MRIDRSQFLRQLSGHIDLGVVWRAVEAEDGGLHCPDLANRPLQLLLEHIFRAFPRRMPRCQVAPSAACHLVLVVECDNLFFTVHYVGVGADDVIYCEYVVVAGGEDYSTLFWNFLWHQS